MEVVTLHFIWIGAEPRCVPVPQTSIGFFVLRTRVKRSRRRTRTLRRVENSAYLSRIERADERTRTADLTSLRVSFEG
jgi:hypothetical protein